MTGSGATSSGPVAFVETWLLDLFASLKVICQWQEGLEQQVTKTDKASDAMTDLEFHASGFVAKVGGTWTDTGFEQFREYLKKIGIVASEDELRAVVENIKEKFWQGDCRVFLCNALPCHTRIRFDLSIEALDRSYAEFGVPVSLTGCQGPCKQAPVLTLRVGNRSECFAQVASPADWQTVLKFANKAAAAGTLLIDPEEAQQYRFDPVHDEPKQNIHLNHLLFLLGHFRGEGKYAMTGYTFQKEVIGTFEAGGRFIALRMDASYPLPDGRKDVHKAFVIAGSEPSSDSIKAHVYTDGGTVREYSIESGNSQLSFDDVPPGHGKIWKRARKILRPTQEGFEERLEVDSGDGSFVPYYVIVMRKVVR